MNYTPAKTTKATIPADKSKALLGLIHIYHPSYPDTAFVTLPTSDDGGVNYLVAYYICCLLANNVWHQDQGRQVGSESPFLSRSSSPADRITIPADDILRDTEYYFHVPAYPNPKEPYPLVPTIQHWPFPHGNVPEPWKLLQDVNAQNRAYVYDHKTKLLNEPCRLTGSYFSLEACHIIPKKMGQWYGINRMHKYLKFYTSEGPIDAGPNLASFRADVHKSFNDQFMMPVPKCTDRERNTYKLLVHVLQPTRSEAGYLELCDLYHNHELMPLADVSHEYLFARFAYSIFNDFTFPLYRSLQFPILSVVREGQEKVHRWWPGQMSGDAGSDSDSDEAEDCDQWRFTARAMGFDDIDGDTDDDSDS